MVYVGMISVLINILLVVSFFAGRKHLKRYVKSVEIILEKDEPIKVICSQLQELSRNTKGDMPYVVHLTVGRLLKEIS